MVVPDIDSQKSDSVCWKHANAMRYIFASAAFLLGFSFVLLTGLPSAARPTPTGIVLGSQTTLPCSIVPDETGGVATASFSVPKTVMYTVWARIAAAGQDPASVYVQIDEACPFRFAVPDTAEPGEWVWVNTRQSTSGTKVPVRRILAEGSHTLKLVSDAPGLRVDSMMFSHVSDCTPEGDGSNCLDSGTVPTPRVE